MQILTDGSSVHIRTHTNQLAIHICPDVITPFNAVNPHRCHDRYVTATPREPTDSLSRHASTSNTPPGLPSTTDPFHPARRQARQPEISPFKQMKDIEGAAGKPKRSGSGLAHDERRQARREGHGKAERIGGPRARR